MTYAAMLDNLIALITAASILVYIGDMLDAARRRRDERRRARVEER